MKPCLVKKQNVHPNDLIGRILCHDLVRGGAATRAGLRKGHWISEKNIPILLDDEWDELHLIEPGADDLLEEEGGLRLAKAIAGSGIVVKTRPQGKCELIATQKGLFKVEVESLRRLNTLEGVSVYTLFSNQVVCQNETVAHAQITPLVISRKIIEEAEQIVAGAGGLIRVAPFSHWQVGVLVTGRVDERGRERFRSTLIEKLRWFGSEDLLNCVHLPCDQERIRKTIQAFLGSGTNLLLVAGSNAMDPLDPVFQALHAVGARMDRFGMPTHPGTLLWMATLNQMVIIGLPACGMYSHRTVFDLLLPRLLAEGKMEASELADFGHGGLLNTTMDFRYPPYTAIENVESE